MQEYRKLEVWQVARSLTLAVYEATGKFPEAERFGLASQMRRSCVSINANIAEGCGRGSTQDFARFLQMALGSAFETECHIVLARDLKYFSAADYERLQPMNTRVKRMLSGLLAKVRNSA